MAATPLKNPLSNRFSKREIIKDVIRTVMTEVTKVESYGVNINSMGFKSRGSEDPIHFHPPNKQVTLRGTFLIQLK